jgi:hypothetical protein
MCEVAFSVEPFYVSRTSLHLAANSRLSRLLASDSRSPLGFIRHRGGHSLQNPRMYATTSLISWSVSRSPNAGIICESPRDGPPCTITAFQLPFGSGVVPAQSVKSGNVSDRLKTVPAMGAPFPSLP